MQAFAVLHNSKTAAAQQQNSLHKLPDALLVHTTW
jgi:hypothetical protein